MTAIRPGARAARRAPQALALFRVHPARRLPRLHRVQPHAAADLLRHVRARVPASCSNASRSGTCRSSATSRSRDRDGARFAELLTPRDLSKCQVGEGRYVLLTDDAGGIVNDPVLLRLDENRFWLAVRRQRRAAVGEGRRAAHAGCASSCASSTSRRCSCRDRNRGRSRTTLFGERIAGARVLPFLRDQARRHSADRDPHRLDRRARLRALPARSRRAAKTCGIA